MFRFDPNLTLGGKSRAKLFTAGSLRCAKASLASG